LPDLTEERIVYALVPLQFKQSADLAIEEDGIFIALN
jgi:hypothetical protein